MQLCNLSLDELDLRVLCKLNILDNISKVMPVVSLMPTQEQLKMHRVINSSDNSLYGNGNLNLQSKETDNNDIENDALLCSNYNPFTQLTNANKIRFATLVYRGMQLLTKLFLYEATNSVGTHYDESIKYNNKVSNRKASDVQNLSPLQIAGQFYNQILEIYFNKSNILTKYIQRSHDKSIYCPTFWIRPDHDLTLIFDEAHLIHPNIGYKGFFDSTNSVRSNMPNIDVNVVDNKDTTSIKKCRMEFDLTKEEKEESEKAKEEKAETTKTEDGKKTET